MNENGTISGAEGNRDENALPSSYNGMHVEVFDDDEQLLFEADLKIINERLILLHRISDLLVPDITGDIPVSIRGFLPEQNLGVHMRGTLSRLARSQDRDWILRDFTVIKTDRGRTFIRTSLQITAWITPPDQPDAPREKCTVINASFGGVRIRTGVQMESGERFQIHFKFRPGKQQPPLACAVRRITQRDGEYEYGCQFVDITPEIDSIIARTVIELQLMPSDDAQ